MSMGNWKQPFAVLADIHGNALALAAVMDDMRKRGICRAVNLGDSFYGPLDPAKTARLLEKLNPVSVLGNQDRMLLEPTPALSANPTFRYVMDNLSPGDLARLAKTPPVVHLADNAILCCHGTPEDDTIYLTEETASGNPVVRPYEDVAAHLKTYTASLVLCGHTHLPKIIHCGKTMVVNPGSVGLPAYRDDEPPHTMSAGSPHARYAIISRQQNDWQAQDVLVEYNWNAAAAQAMERGRTDWANWLQNGVAS